MSSPHDRITTDPNVMVGKPTIKGTRITVELILGWLASGWSIEQVLENYPNLVRDDVLAALGFAAEYLRNECRKITPQTGELAG